MVCERVLALLTNRQFKGASRVQTLLKILLSLIVVIVVVIGAAVVLIPMLVDPNDYKAEIAEVTKAQTVRGVP